ncbi:MAG: response regulator [Caldilineae bacterium]|nr:MAG: response regulator [Caldilineae bacterium]
MISQTNDSALQVLIAEDEPMVAEMIRTVVEDAGYAVTGVAHTGRQTVEMTCRLRPDVLLLDIQMPEMDGLEAARHIQKTCPTPVVVLTAFENQELLAAAGEVGVGAYLLKPPNPQQVQRAVTIATARFDDLMEVRRLNAELEARNKELEEALAKVKTLSGLLPICANCKKIRDDEGYWQQVELYIEEHSDARFSHGLCPDCARELYPDIFTGKK